MKKWMIKKYKIICMVFLAICLVGWTSFIQYSEHKAAAGSERKTTDSASSGKDNTVGTDDASAEDSALTQHNVDEPSVATTAAPDIILNDADSDNAEDSLNVCEDDPESIDVVQNNDFSESEDLADNDGADDNETAVEPEPVDVSITFKYAVADVTGKLNIRKEAEPDSEVLGILPSGAYCEVIERSREWAKIKSGDITGYVSSEYMVFNEEAVEKLTASNELFIKVISSKLNVRSEANTECTVLGTAGNGDKFIYLPYESVDGWYRVQYSETQAGFVTDEFSIVYITAPEAVKEY